MWSQENAPGDVSENEGFNAEEDENSDDPEERLGFEHGHIDRKFMPSELGAAYDGFSVNVDRNGEPPSRRPAPGTA